MSYPLGELTTLQLSRPVSEMSDSELLLVQSILEWLKAAHKFAVRSCK